MAFSHVAQMKALPPKRQINIGGETLAYSVAGSGSPVVVLINGAGVGMEGWYRLHPAIAEAGTVIAYDRPGTGGSSRPCAPQTGETAVATLRALLADIGARPPYVLVGHSFGGLYANLFARLYPREVAAVLFLEATAPEDVAAMKQHLSTTGIVLNTVLSPFTRRDPNDEIEHENLTVAQIAAAPPFPAIPVRVISGGKRLPSWLLPPAAQNLRDEHQTRLAQLSPSGKRIIAARSGHFPQMTEPELVLGVIAELRAAIPGEPHSAMQ